MDIETLKPGSLKLSVLYDTDPQKNTIFDLWPWRRLLNLSV